MPRDLLRSRVLMERWWEDCRLSEPNLGHIVKLTKQATKTLQNRKAVYVLLAEMFKLCYRQVNKVMEGPGHVLKSSLKKNIKFLLGFVLNNNAECERFGFKVPSF